MSLRDRAGAAWLFRAKVEHDAVQRFERLSGELAALDAESPLIERLVSAAQDEKRHLGMCVELLSRFGAKVPVSWPEPENIVPAGLNRRQALLYELVAACCIAETESMATLTTLLQHEAEPEVGVAVRSIARDEVRHAQLGWAHLARERSGMDVGFLAPLLPAMLSGGVGDLFAGGDPVEEDARLIALGVLPRSMKREVFVRALDEIILPGLLLNGVDDAPARAWLAQQRASP